MMQKSGWSKTEYMPLAEKKLSATEIKRLNSIQDKAELIVIEHAGSVPAAKEMNLIMSVQDTDLLLQPVLLGDQIEHNEQFAWFFMMYADKGLINLIQNYNSGGINSAIEGFYSAKHFGIAPLYAMADSMGLIAALSANPVRVTVPYMAPINKTTPPKTQLHINDKTYKLYTSESVAHLALYERIINANHELQMAVTRESLKAVLAKQAVDAAKSTTENSNNIDILLGFAANMVAASLSQAETRSWLLLPYEIRIRRIAVAPGSHHIKLTGGIQQEKQVKVEANEIYIWKARNF